MGEKVRKVAEEFKKALPENIQLDLVHDQAAPSGVFRRNHFMTNLFEGLAIVILVMFLSMGARSATLIAFSLPLSILLTFAVMPLFGVDLETVSIAAFIIALGMLVDNAIIVTDNIDVHLSRGETPFEAAWRGTRELSISCVDRHTCNRAGLPATAFIERRNRRLRACVAYCRLFLASGFAGAGGNHDADRRPHLSQTPHQRKRHERESRRSSLPSVPIVDRKVFEIPKERDFSDACGFVGAMALLPIVGFSFFPEAERDQFTISIWLPEGSSLQHTENVTRQVLDRLRKEKTCHQHRRVYRQRRSPILHDHQTSIQFDQLRSGGRFHG